MHVVKRSPWNLTAKVGADARNHAQPTWASRVIPRQLAGSGSSRTPTIFWGFVGSMGLVVFLFFVFYFRFHFFPLIFLSGSSKLMVETSKLNENGVCWA